MLVSLQKVTDAFSPIEFNGTASLGPTCGNEHCERGEQILSQEKEGRVRSIEEMSSREKFLNDEIIKAATESGPKSRLILCGDVPTAP